MGILDSGSNESSEEDIEIGKNSSPSKLDINGSHKHQNSQKWKVVKTVRNCIYKVRTLNPGEIFGHDEFVDHFEKVLETQDGKTRMNKRYYRVIAAEKCDVFYINVAQFYHFFSDLELKNLRKHKLNINNKDIQQKVKTYFASKKIGKQSMLNGMNINLMTQN